MRFAVVAFVATLACSARSPAQAGPTVQKDAAELGRDLDRFLSATLSYPDRVNGGVLVAKDGEILLAKGYGVADADTGRAIDRDSLWDVASITKQFTAAGVLLLQQQGKLSLSDPLSKFFADVPPDKAQVTLRQLLNHTSGIANRYDHEATAKTVDFQDRSAAISFYLKLPMAAEPGTAWAYSNLAYNLVAAVIEDVSGKTWEEFIREDVLRKAGMRDSWPLGHPDLPRARVPRGSLGKGAAFPYGEVSHWAGYRGAGGVHTTLDDLFRWDRALRGDALLDARSRQLLFEVGMNGYALGWQITTDAAGAVRASHGGAVNGFVSHLLRGVDEDIVVAVLGNDFTPDRASSTAEILYDMARSGHAIAPAAPLALDAEALSAYAGRYEADTGVWLAVAPRDGALQVEVRDWKLARALLRQQGAMVDAGATVNQRLPECLAGLAKGERTHVSPQVQDAAVETWRAALAPGSPRGELRGSEIVGYYFASVGHVEQFAVLRFANGEALTRFHWLAGRLTEVEPDVGAYASFAFQNAGKDVFRHGTEQSWRAALIRFIDDGGLLVNGSAQRFRRVVPVRADTPRNGRR